MTTTVQPITVDPLAAALAAVTGPDANLDTIVYLLRRASELPAEQIDPSPYRAQERLKTVCWIAARTLATFDAEVRAAPPAALAEVVREVMTECLAPSCGATLAPWQGNVCDDAQCRREVHAAFGEC